METQVKAAIATQNYRQASQLLKQWQQSDAQNPLLRFYAAQLQEKTNRLEAAEKNYKKLLQQNAHRKIVSEARAGIARIHAKQKAEKAAALEKARAVSGAEEKAILAIAAPSDADRTDAIAGFAKIFNLDAYTARMKLPSTGFRIYRIGPWGELSYFQQQLAEANLVAFCSKVTAVKAIEVFQVTHFEALIPEPTVVCKNSAGQLGKISFDWKEVTQQVQGQLPIFEQVVDLGPRGRTVHKEKVQDYAQVVDLHLPGRKVVLRLCDRLYQYQKGIELSKTNEINSRILWNQLLSKLNTVTSIPHHSEFNRFGKSALEFINLLPIISPNLDIDRRSPSDWDVTFHLYSSLCYLQRDS
ncbi:MAG: tetratricopeptide repeat protein [Cyanobacteria bacterium J06621_11]